MRIAKVVDMDTVLTFGKYAGETIEEILTEDPYYIKWCINKGIIIFEDKKDMEILVLLVTGKDQYDEFYRSCYNFYKD